MPLFFCMSFPVPRAQSHNVQLLLSDEQEKDIKTMEKVNYELFWVPMQCKVVGFEWKETK